MQGSRRTSPRGDRRSPPGEPRLGPPASVLAARTTVALASGQITGEEGETFTAGGTAYTIDRDGVINLGKPTVFDAKNIDQFNFWVWKGC